MSPSMTTLSPASTASVRPLRSRRDRLQDERRFRIEQLAALKKEIAANPTLTSDEVTMALRAAAAAVLRDVNAALLRMDAGQYGRCQRCTHPISPDRLDVLPMATLCMPCQYEQQIRGR